MIPLIIARPEPGNSETARAARALGLNIVACPLFEMQPLDWNADNSEAYDALFITSFNALRAAGQELARYKHLPLYAVGSASGAAARAIGFSTVIEGSADGAALADLSAANGHHRLLHLVGNPHKPIVHPSLRFDVRCVYDMSDLPVPQVLVDALDGPCVVLAHSPRIAKRLAALTPDRRQCHMVAISEQTASAAGQDWASCLWPDQPDSAAMLQLAAPLCRGA